ncbi:MAG TPA: TonB-dependent receptor [Bryobacteraceae bacterium]|nr:TonB-dependent receptor [Bryobacteraceae bacterium]
MSIEVADMSGAIIQGAAVQLTGPTGTQKAESDLRGRAVFFNLAPGNYAVRAEFQGFRVAEVKSFAVSANQRSSLRVSLEPGAVTEVVQVSERVATVDTATTTTGGVLSQEQYANIPVGRNVTALFSLAAGVSDGGGTGTANPSISGASGLENQYIIDGINATDQGYGAFGVWSSVYGSIGSGVNFDFVKEVQVKTGGFEAQYGQALGGVVNIVTDSGGNDIHGSAYAYTNPGWSEAGYRQPNDLRTADPKTETWRRSGWDVGFNIGGPILKDKFFWYGSFNPSFSDEDRLGPQNFGTRALGMQDWKRRSYNWVGKLNYNFTQNHKLEGTAFGDPSRDPSGVHRSLVRDDLDSASSNAYGTRNWAVKYSGLFGAKTLLAASFGINHTYFIETATNNAFAIRDYTKVKPNAAYTLAGGAGFLENSEGDNRQYNTMLTRNANLFGGHQIDIGYGFNQVRYDAMHIYSGPDWALPEARGIPASAVGKMTHGGTFYLYATRTVGGVTYNNVYRNYRGNYTDPAVTSATDYHNAFAQDAWQINRYVTAKLGLRWEQQQINGNQNRYTFAANWAPRLGFIIDPTGNRKTKLMASWGRFFEKVPQDLAVRAMSMESSYMNGNFFGLPPTQANLVPGSTFSPYGTEPTIIAGGTKAQYQEEIVLGAEHEFRGMILSARFIHRNVKRIIEDISGATVESADAGAEQNFVVTNPSLGLDLFHNPTACTSGANCDTDTGFTVGSGMFEPDGKPDLFPDPRRVYKAFELTMDKRFGSNWSLTANYRLAKLFGNYEGLYRNDNDQSDPNITSLFDFIWSEALADQFAVGPLPNDRRHVANVFGNYVFRKRLNLGIRWTAQTGSPLNKLLAHPSYGNKGEVPVGGRGAFGRTPFQNYWDLKASYDLPFKAERYKTTVSVDMLNLFNRKTITTVDQFAELDGGVASVDWMKPLTYRRPFYARFSLRFQF